MKVTATTLPRRDASVTSRAVLRGQGEVGRRPDRRQPLFLLMSRLMRLDQRRAGQERRAIRTNAARMAHAFSSRLSSFEEAPVRPFRDDLLRGRLDHADLVQAQRIEPHRVLGVVLAPFVVRATSVSVWSA